MNLHHKELLKNCVDLNINILFIVTSRHFVSGRSHVVSCIYNNKSTLWLVVTPFPRKWHALLTPIILFREQRAPQYLRHLVWKFCTHDFDKLWYFFITLDFWLFFWFVFLVYRYLSNNLKMDVPGPSRTKRLSL